jgi:hypothetical protein
LAYADWLEERGDPRADYLRAIAALRQAVRERDATPEDWLPVHRYWKGRHDAWQRDVGGRFDVVVTEFPPARETEVGYVLGRTRARSLAARCRDSGWELVWQGQSLDGAARACRGLTSAGCKTMLRASRLSYPYDHSRLASCISSGGGEWLTSSLPQGTLATSTEVSKRPPAIFSGQHGSAVLANVAAIDLLARTSGYVPDKRGLSAILPPWWYTLNDPAEPQRMADGIDFYCHDRARGWTLHGEYRPSGCRVSAVERTPEGPR